MASVLTTRPNKNRSSGSCMANTSPARGAFREGLKASRFVRTAAITCPALQTHPLQVDSVLILAAARKSPTALPDGQRRSHTAEHLSAVDRVVERSYRALTSCRSRAFSSRVRRPPRRGSRRLPTTLGCRPRHRCQLRRQPRDPRRWLTRRHHGPLVAREAGRSGQSPRAETAYDQEPPSGQRCRWRGADWSGCEAADK